MTIVEPMAESCPTSVFYKVEIVGGYGKWCGGSGLSVGSPVRLVFEVLGVN